MRDFFLILFLTWYAFSDLKHREVLVLPVPFLIAAGLVLRYRAEGGSLPALLSGLLPGIALIPVSKCRRRWIGCGDALVFMVCGAVCGAGKTLELMFISLVFAGLMGILILMKGGNKDTEFPFVPFVLAAALARLCQPPLP